MRQILFLFAILIGLSSCSAAKKKSGVLATGCGPTPISVKDLEALGFKPEKNKIVVMRIFATWCPYCKEDFSEIGGHFANKSYQPENVQLLLLSYNNPRETKASFDTFVRETFPHFGIPAQATQLLYVNKNYAELSKTKSSGGEPLFTGWQGVPFTLIFGKDGRLVFRGHFTTSPQFQDGHYAFIKRLTSETCGQPAL